jgi:signal peptidase I
MFKKLSAFFFDIIEVIVFAIAIFLFVYLLVMQPHKIKGDSMQPNYPDGEFLLTDKISYKFGEPKRGDVVVFKAPVAEDEYIKRIIGLPGEKVKVQSAHVYLNGKLLNETYLAPTLITASGNFMKEGVEVTVPEGEYLVFGDNRPASSDSRAWGFVTKSAITGKAWIIYWPPERMGLVDKVSY